jgi:hypothetical protein
MIPWLRRVIPLLLLITIGFWIWTWIFPSPRNAIRKRLTEVAQAASFNADEGAVAKLQNNQKLVGCCTPDIQIIVDVNGQRRTCNGKDELFQTLMFARAQVLSSCNVELQDPVITISPNKQNAFVDLTVRARSSNDPDLILQECNFTFQKIGRSWLIRKIEPVKTLR